MMLDQVVRRQEVLVERLGVAKNVLRERVRAHVASVRRSGSPSVTAELVRTIGLHIPEHERSRLVAQQKRWGFSNYRDTVYTALLIGLDALCDTLPEAPPAPKLRVAGRDGVVRPDDSAAEPDDETDS